MKGKLLNQFDAFWGKTITLLVSIRNNKNNFVGWTDTDNDVSVLL